MVESRQRMRELIYLCWQNLAEKSLTWLNPDSGERITLPIEQLKAKLPKKHVPIVLLLKGCDVNVLQAKLPEISAKQLSLALPGLLETQVASELQEIHLSLLKRSSEGENSQIAVVSKSLLFEHLEPLREYGIKIDYCLPDYLCLTTQKDWFILVDNYYERAYGIHPSLTGFSVDAHELSSILSCIKTQGTIDNDLYINETDKLSEFLISTPEYLPGNLLQGEFKLNHTQKTSNYYKLGVAACLFLACAIQLIGGLFHNRQLMGIEQQLNSELFALYKQVFPNSVTLNSPKILLQRELDKTITNHSQSDFFNLLTNFATKQNENVTLNGIQFQNNSLTVDLEAVDFSDVETLIATLKDSKISVKQQEAYSEGDKVKTKLVLSEHMA